ELWLYGGGHKADNERIALTLEHLPEGLRDRVKVKGYVKRTEMLRSMKKAHFFVSVPTRDGTPLSLLEAMMLELYPIVSDIDANREWLTTDTAQFVSNASAEQIARAFEQAVKAWYMEGWRERNRAIVLGKANFQRNVEKFQNLLISKLV